MTRKVITELTPAQIGMLDGWAQKWIQIALRSGTSTISDDDVAKFYKIHGHNPPQVIRRCQSPVHAQALADADNDTYIDDNGKEQRLVLYAFNPTCYGHHEAAWVGNYSFFTDVVDPDILKGEGTLHEDFAHMRHLCENSGWIYAFENLCFVIDRPKVYFDERNRVHRDGALPAIEFADGWGVYVVHGITVPEWIMTNPEKITVESIINERNMEVRRVMMELYGEERFLQNGKQYIARQHTDHTGTLYRFEFGSDRDVLTMARVINSTREPDGTYKIYWLTCDNDLRPLIDDTTFGRAQDFACVNAVGASFGLTGAEYAPEAES